jgi:hypothetical protein
VDDPGTSIDLSRNCEHRVFLNRASGKAIAAAARQLDPPGLVNEKLVIDSLSLKYISFNP